MYNQIQASTMKRSADFPGLVPGLVIPKRRKQSPRKDVNNINDKEAAQDDPIANNNNNNPINVKKCVEGPKASKASVRKDRNESMESTVSMSTFIENNLSAKAKQALLRLEKNKSQDPFNEENQSLLNEFATEFAQRSNREVSLAEAGVLLDGAGQVYVRQVKRLHSDVLALATFCATTPKPKPKEVSKASAEQNQITTEGENGEQGQPSANSVDPEKGTTDGPLEGERNEASAAEGENKEMDQAAGVPGNDGQDGSLDTSGGDALTESHAPTEEEQNLFLQSLVLDGVGGMNLDAEGGDKSGPEFNPENMVTSTPSKENVDAPSARTRGMKKGLTINDLLKDNSFFKSLGITLNGQPKTPRPRVPKLLPYYKIPIVVGPDDEAPPLLYSWDSPQLLENLKSNDIITDINRNIILNNATNAEPVTLTSVVPEGVALEADKVKEDGLIKSEDLACIHKFIQQLHYLSLNTEVSQHKKEGMFKNAVKQLQKIFETYNLTQSGASTLNDTGDSHNSATQTLTIPNSAVSSEPIPSCSNSAPSSTIVSSPASTPCPGSRKSSIEEDDNDLNLDLESLHESFSESFDEESTVMQRTKEKSRKESKHRLQEALSTILSPIVKKHSIKPLIEEHSEAFFRKVESFQTRMKKILEEEKRKDQFNLTTYEQELLEVANKDMDSDDGSQVARPVSNMHDQLESDSISKDFAEPQSPCRSETSSNSNGLKWIKLENLFAHVKNQDRREAARYFCAVLGLLSFENFDVNYDRLYDAVSAKKVKKVHDHTQDQKYPRGAKIVQSRCPDVNEVFVTALSSVSRTESFRQKEHGVSEEDIKKMHQAEFLQATGAQAAFEQVQGEIYTGELFSKRSRSIQARKLLKAQEQAKKEMENSKGDTVAVVP